MEKKTKQISTVETCISIFWCSFGVESLYWRNGEREAVSAERMRLSEDKSRSGMIMLVRENWAYPDRQYGFPARSLISVTHTHTHTHLHRVRYFVSLNCPWERCLPPTAPSLFLRCYSINILIYWCRYHDITFEKPFSLVTTLILWLEKLLSVILNVPIDVVNKYWVTFKQKTRRCSRGWKLTFLSTCHCGW